MGSLNRDSWKEMWEHVYTIEKEANRLAERSHSEVTRVRAKAILRETSYIKEQIQSVIGQME